MGGIAAFRLGEWRVEPAANTLTRDGEEIRLEPKVMEVLSCLVAHAGEVVTKRRLIDEVWRARPLPYFAPRHKLTEQFEALHANTIGVIGKRKRG